MTTDDKPLRRIQKKAEQLLQSLWPMTRRDAKKHLNEIQSIRRLLLDQYNPLVPFVADLVAALRSGQPGQVPEVAYDFDRISNDLVLIGEAKNKSLPCVAAVAIGDEYRKRMDPCLRTHQQYCTKHGLDYFIVDKAANNFRHRGFRHPAWAKIPLVNRLMGDGYPYCMVIDADLAIINDSVPPDAFTALFKPESDLVLNEGDEYFNTGFIIGRNTPTIRALMNAVWTKEKYRNFGSWEQDAMIDLFIEHREIRKKAEIVGPRTLQSTPTEYKKKYGTRDCYLVQPGDFSVHFVQAQGAELQAMMAKYIPTDAGRAPKFGS